MYGSFRVNTVNIMVIVNPKISFTVKYGWSGILSVFLFSPSGLFDPVWCRNNKWINTIAAIANGIITVASHSKAIQKVVRPTRSPRQQ